MKRGFDNIEGLGQSQIDECGAVICIPDVDRWHRDILEYGKAIFSLKYST